MDRFVRITSLLRLSGGRSVLGLLRFSWAPIEYKFGFNVTASFHSDENHPFSIQRLTFSGSEFERRRNLSSANQFLAVSYNIHLQMTQNCAESMMDAKR